MEEEESKTKSDKSSGIRYYNNGRGGGYIDEKTVLLNPDNSLFVDGKTYQGIPGFWFLVTEKTLHGYTDVDLMRYQEPLHQPSSTKIMTGLFDIQD